MLVDGVAVEYRRADGSIAGTQARVIDFDAPDNNDWLAVNQFTVAEGQHARRPDAVLFVNGLPLAVIGAGKEWFKPWRTITGREDAAARLAELQVVVEGVFEKRRFLDLVRHFIVFEDSSSDGGGGTLVKKMAGYHQFHAVNVAIEETLRAAQVAANRIGQPLGRYEAGGKPDGDPGDRRVKDGRPLPDTRDCAGHFSGPWVAKARRYDARFRM